MSESPAGIEVSVVLALLDHATEVPLRLPAGATVADALERSGLATRHPELDLARAAVGIFGKRTDRQTVLADGERVEIYRALIADPKTTRRARAAAPVKPKPT